MNASGGLRSTALAAALVCIPVMGGFVPAAAQSPSASSGGSGTAADTIPTQQGGDLTIHPLHHGTFVMTWNERTIYVDPAPPPGQDREASAAAALKAFPSPDIILVTDIHGDHLSIPTLIEVATSDDTRIVAPQAAVEIFPSNPLRGKAMRLSNGRTITVKGIQIEAVPMYNLTKDRLQYHEKGRGNGYVLTIGGKRIYVAGDTEGVPEMRALRNIDVAFVPMNLPYTMTPTEAADAVRAFKPRVVYPYHFGKSDVSEFTRLVGTDAGVEVRVRKWYP
jgi:L-ascorbate metabolism protein UlaG (beta-lactamase superfamily)